MTLLDFLRSPAVGLTGSKLGCAEGMIKYYPCVEKSCTPLQNKKAYLNFVSFRWLWRLYRHGLTLRSRQRQSRVLGKITMNLFKSYNYRFQRHFSVNGCLAPVCSVDGMAVTTIEGLGTVKEGLDPVQTRMAAGHGSQCKRRREERG